MSGLTRPIIRPLVFDLFKIGIEATTLLKGSGAVIPHWDGVTKFRPDTRTGLNIVALAFETEAPVAAGTWSNFMTTQRWDQIKELNPGYIRIPVDTTSVLISDGSSESINEFINIIKEAIDDCLNHEIPALLNMHVASYNGSNPAANDAALVASFPNGNLWLKVEAVWEAVATLLRDYSGDEVGFEVYNETAELDYTVFGPMLQRLEFAFRKSNKTTTLIFPSCRAASAEGFVVPGFTADMFGQNSGFSVHSYTPVEFVYQNLPNSGYTQYITNLAFPVVSSDHDAAKARATANINADDTLTSEQKTALINQTNFQLDYYFNNFSLAGAANVYAYFFGTNDFAGENLGQWIIDNNVNPADIHVTEFGTGTGADTTSRAAFLDFASRWWSNRGWSSSLWVEDDTSFGIRDGASFNPQLTLALGWTPKYLSMLSDDFSTNEINPNIWSTFGEGVTGINGRAELPMTSSYNSGFTSIATDYQLIGSEITLETGFVGGDDSFNLAIDIRDLGNQNNAFVWSIERYNVRVLYKVAGVETEVLSNVEYNNTFTWLRIREENGTVYFDHSSDKISWVNFTSSPIPSGLSMEAVSVSFNAGAWQDQTGIAWVDNINK